MRKLEVKDGPVQVLGQEVFQILLDHPNYESINRNRGILLPEGTDVQRGDFLVEPGSIKEP